MMHIFSQGLVANGASHRRRSLGPNRWFGFQPQARIGHTYSSPERNGVLVARPTFTAAVFAAFALTAMALLVFCAPITHAQTNGDQPAGLVDASVRASERSLPDCEPGTSNPDGSPRNHQDYALCMAAELDHATKAITDGDDTAALDHISKAYFDWYENQLEPHSMILPGHRKATMEGRFTRVKLAIKSDPTDPSIPVKLNDIKVAVARDAMVLDGVLPNDSEESEGAALLTKGQAETTNASVQRWVDFSTAMTLLLREGLEAMLVVVAIVLYLMKSGNRALVRHVYLGALAAIVVSFFLAWLLKALIGGAGQASELLEGATMFLAVAMLFYVSNWMLSKSSGQQWQHYIESMVETSVSTGAARALVFAAFLAVVREGAELVLFYTASFSNTASNPLWIALGFGAGVLILAVIFLIFRYGGAKLPVRPIFTGTSILLFIMCISFVGKGVQELKEANVILGSTNLPWVPYYLPELGIYPQAETLLPQLILAIAAIWLLVTHRRPRKREASRSNPSAASERPSASSA